MAEEPQKRFETFTDDFGNEWYDREQVDTEIERLTAALRDLRYRSPLTALDVERICEQALRRSWDYPRSSPVETSTLLPNAARSHKPGPRCDGNNCKGHPFNCYGHPYDCGCSAEETTEGRPWYLYHQWGQDNDYKWYQSCHCRKCADSTAAIAKAQERATLFAEKATPDHT